MQLLALRENFCQRARHSQGSTFAWIVSCVKKSLLPLTSLKKPDISAALQIHMLQRSLCIAEELKQANVLLKTQSKEINLKNVQTFSLTVIFDEQLIQRFTPQKLISFLFRSPCLAVTGVKRVSNQCQLTFFSLPGIQQCKLTLLDRTR